MYALMYEFLDDNEEDTPVRWSPQSTSKLTTIPFTLPESLKNFCLGEIPAFPMGKKVADILSHKTNYEDYEESLFKKLPNELIARLSSLVAYTDLHSWKMVNSRVCRIVQSNWKHLDKPPLEIFAISREKRNILVNGFLHHKATYRALLTANDYEVIHVEAKTRSGKSWWNYQIRRAGEGDRIADDVCPSMYCKVQSAPGVIDKLGTLAKHLDYFWTKCKLLNLVLNDVEEDDLSVVLAAQKKTACTVHRLTLNVGDGDIEGGHVDLINTIKCPEICLDLFGGGLIEPRFWYSRCLQQARTIMIRNRADSTDLNDNIFLSWSRADRIHICTHNSITPEALISVIQDWIDGIREITFICVQKRYENVEWAEKLQIFTPELVEENPNALSIHAPDGREIICAWSQFCFQMGKPTSSPNDFNPEFTYLGGKPM